MVFKRMIYPRFAQYIRQYSEKCKTKVEQPEVTTIVNRLGDGGTSHTVSGETLPKDHIVFEAIGTTEELSSYIGLAREFGQDNGHDYVDKLKRIQTVLIDITTAISKQSGTEKYGISSENTKELEDWICDYYKRLPPAERYIIPGGGQASASLHVARSICRRTERLITPLIREGKLQKEAGVYMNRLSDFLFTASRIAAQLDKRNESIYIPPEEGRMQEQ